MMPGDLVWFKPGVVRLAPVPVFAFETLEKFKEARKSQYDPHDADWLKNFGSSFMVRENQIMMVLDVYVLDKSKTHQALTRLVNVLYNNGRSGWILDGFIEKYYLA